MRRSRPERRRRRSTARLKRTTRWLRWRTRFGASRRATVPSGRAPGAARHVVAPDARARRRRGGTRASRPGERGGGRRRDPVRGFRLSARTSSARAGTRASAARMRFRPSSAGCVSDTWRGCDAQRHLLDALARRSATIAATGHARRRRRRRDPRLAVARAAWPRATLDAVTPWSPAVRAPRTRRSPSIDALHAARVPSLPGPARATRVVETTAALLRSARGAGAPELAAALTWHLGENVNFACGSTTRRRGARRPRGSAPGRTRSGSASASETTQAQWLFRREGRW